MALFHGIISLGTCMLSNSNVSPLHVCMSSKDHKSTMSIGLGGYKYILVYR